jgi:hypothetical protein
MSIKKYIASKDTTITNAFKQNLVARGINSNMGAADSLEVFSIYGQSTSSSLEISRILVEFPIDSIVSDRVSGSLPSSGSVNFILKLFNVEHPFTVPRDYSLIVSPISGAWEEGYGLDMEGYTDDGFIMGYGGYGATWMTARSGSIWESVGGDYLTGSEQMVVSFSSGVEDLEIDITHLVEKWAINDIPNNGLMIKLSSSYEDGSRLTSYYTKKFSARDSEFYFKRPCIEARWNPSVTDDRNNFYASSSLLSDSDNKMNLYFYNKVNGRLKNIVGNQIPTVQFYTDSNLSNLITASYASVSNPLPGVYKAQIAIDTTASVLYDIWSLPSASCFRGSFDILQREADSSSDTQEYIVNITNMKSAYSKDEKVRFNIFVREQAWQPTIYTVAYDNVENTSIPNLYYKIFRFNDNYTIVEYSTGSIEYSKTSYDVNGNYFDIDMNIFEKDYGYGIKLALWDGIQLKEFKNIFKFRVE